MTKQTTMDTRSHRVDKETDLEKLVGKKVTISPFGYARYEGKTKESSHVFIGRLPVPLRPAHLSVLYIPTGKVASDELGTLMYASQSFTDCPKIDSYNDEDDPFVYRLLDQRLKELEI